MVVCILSPTKYASTALVAGASSRKFFVILECLGSGVYVLFPELINGKAHVIAIHVTWDGINTSMRRGCLAS